MRPRGKYTKNKQQLRHSVEHEKLKDFKNRNAFMGHLADNSIEHKILQITKP
jgi:hypothetical protein